MTRNVICFSAAIVLLALMLCAVEVSLRWRNFQGRLSSSPTTDALEAIIAPSRTSWIEVKPFLDLKLESAESGVSRIRTNECGLRARSVVIPKPRGTYRVICLGGDNVFGSRLANQDTLPGRLQQSLNLQAGMPVEVINAGCPTAGPLINLLRYRTHLAALQPDLVILCLSEEDLGHDRDVRGALHLDESKNPAYAAHPGLHAPGSETLDAMCEEFLSVRWLLSFAGQMTGINSRELRSREVAVRENIHRDLAAIVPLSHLVSGHFGRLMISVSPNAWSVDRARNSADTMLSSSTESSLATEVRKFLKKVHLEDRVIVQDGLTPFSQAPDARSYFSPQTGDLSAAGNQVYSQQLSQFLIRSIPELQSIASTPLKSVPNNPNPTPIPRPSSNEQSRAFPGETRIR